MVLPKVWVTREGGACGEYTYQPQDTTGISSPALSRPSSLNPDFPLTPFLSPRGVSCAPTKMVPSRGPTVEVRLSVVLHDEILWSFVYWQGGFEIYFPISSSGWAHVVCALYIPEVQFANVLTMEPIILQYVPHERYLKVHTSTRKWPQHTTFLRKKKMKISFFSYQMEIWQFGKTKLLFWLGSQVSP